MSTHLQAYPLGSHRGEGSWHDVGDLLSLPAGSDVVCGCRLQARMVLLAQEFARGQGACGCRVLANPWGTRKLDVLRVLLAAPSGGCTSGEKSSRLRWECNR